MAKDRTGKDLKVGSKVLIPAVVTEIHPGKGEVLSLIVEFEVPGLAGEKGRVMCNSNQVDNFEGTPVPPPPPPVQGSKVK